MTYMVVTPLGLFMVNVHRWLIEATNAEIAPVITAWAEAQYTFGAQLKGICEEFGHHNVRERFIKGCQKPVKLTGDEDDTKHGGSLLVEGRPADTVCIADLARSMGSVRAERGNQQDDASET